jgi:hypothetical protein
MVEKSQLICKILAPSIVHWMLASKETHCAVSGSGSTRPQAQATKLWICLFDCLIRELRIDCVGGDSNV